MDPENQALIKRIVEEIGSDDVVVILGAADAEAVEVAAQTVRDGWVMMIVTALVTRGMNDRDKVSFITPTGLRGLKCSANRQERNRQK